MIIIGILAAIAIPTYLNQVNKGKDAAAESQLRNAATAQQSYYTGHHMYTTDKTANGIGGEGFHDSTDNPVTITTGNATTYCMSAPGGTGNTWYISTASGAPNTTGC